MSRFFLRKGKQKTRAKPAPPIIIELADGVKRQGDIVLIPDGHKRWPGLRGDQEFSPLFGEGMLVAIKDLDDGQRRALGLDP